MTPQVVVGACALLTSPRPSRDLKLCPCEGTCHGRGVTQGKAFWDDAGWSSAEISHHSSVGFRSEFGLVVSHSSGWKRHFRIKVSSKL